MAFTCSNSLNTSRARRTSFSKSFRFSLRIVNFPRASTLGMIRASRSGMSGLSRSHATRSFHLRSPQADTSSSWYGGL